MLTIDGLNADSVEFTLFLGTWWPCVTMFRRDITDPSDFRYSDEIA